MGDRGPRADGGSPGGQGLLAVIGTAVPIDELLGALADRRRRLVLYYLRDRGTADVDDVATHVVAAETEIGLDEVTDEQRTRIASSLIHAHLPRLADAGLVDYDPRTGAIRYAHPPTLLEKILAVLEELEAPGEDGER